MVIESLAQALRNAGFMLPGALAVQEGAIIGAAALVGCRRGWRSGWRWRAARGKSYSSLPGLLAWQRAEGMAMRDPAGPPGPGARGLGAWAARVLG